MTEIKRYELPVEIQRKEANLFGWPLIIESKVQNYSSLRRRFCTYTAFLTSSRLLTDCLTKVFLLLSSRIIPVFSNLRLNFLSALSMFSPSLIGTIITLTTPPFHRGAKVWIIFITGKLLDPFLLTLHH